MQRRKSEMVTRLLFVETGADGTSVTGIKRLARLCVPASLNQKDCEGNESN